MGWSTEDTAMELNGEGAANFEQLKDLIRKECDKQDHCYAHLEDKYKKLEHQVSHHNQQKNMAKRGQQPTSDGPDASKKNKSDERQAPNQGSNCPGSIPPSNTGQTNRKTFKNQGRAIENNNGTRSKNENKPPLPSQTMECSWQEKTATESTTKKLILQFGFAADPTLSTQHNASITLATTPTWYYFSRPSNLAFHDFMQKHKPEKSMVTIGTWIKIHFNTKSD